MLEEEGIQFEGGDGKDGKRKIREEFFIGSTTAAKKDSKCDNSNRSDGSKRQKTQHQVDVDKKSPETLGSTDSNKPTTKNDAMSEKTLQQEILTILQKRAPGKTC